MDDRDERVALWVRLCESLCAPEQVVRYDDREFRFPLAGSGGAFSSLDGEKADTAERLTLAEMTWQMVGLAGVLRGRTMYVIPYAGVGAPMENTAGLMVTDSPHVIDSLRQRFAAGRAALAALRASPEIVAELHLAFPPRHYVVPISRDAPEVRESFAPCEPDRDANGPQLYGHGLLGIPWQSQAGRV